MYQGFYWEERQIATCKKISVLALSCEIVSFKQLKIEEILPKLQNIAKNVLVFVYNAHLTRNTIVT